MGKIHELEKLYSMRALSCRNHFVRALVGLNMLITPELTLTIL